MPHSYTLIPTASHADGAISPGPSGPQDSHHVPTEVLLAAAALGWTPNDLRHLLGKRACHFPSEACSQIVSDATAEEPIARAWLQQGQRTGEEITRPVGIQPLIDRLRELPRLRDAEIFTEDLSWVPQRTPPETRSYSRSFQRIEKLLCKAESSTFEAESLALVAKAQLLRHRYLSYEPADTASLVSMRVRLQAPWIKHQFLLLANIAPSYSCSTVLMTRSGIACLIGHPEDVEHCRRLFSSLNRQRLAFLPTHTSDSGTPSRGQVAAYRGAFFHAYAERIGTLLSSRQPARQRARRLASQRHTIATNYVFAKFHRTRALGFHHRDSQGLVDGLTAAEQSNFRPELAALLGTPQSPEEREPSRCPEGRLRSQSA
ncbi:DUF2786 domain-containing protein [Corynebacterium alimapuense]|uniref:DUF2786 domain-containing protein n=1 Tax=Corynebacterium alimapuense TaxID=1576874 RepID=A0A3M8KAR4_9CORY|nr:hypothetical protein C5L39_04140 [Corynebacterium alimapuense]